MNWIASVIISCKNNLSNGEEICLISDGLEKIGIISFNNLSSVILLNLHEFLLTPLTDHHFTSWSWHMHKHVHESLDFSYVVTHKLVNFSLIHKNYNN